MRVLIIEDHVDLRLAITAELRGAGFAVDAVDDLPAADEALWVNTYDCAVFDRQLPSGDSMTYVRSMKASGSTVPVLFLTALDAVADRVAGLEHGDDHLGKPFAMAELVARVSRLCRLATTGSPAVLRCGDLEIDLGRHQVRRANVLLTLTTKEFAVLELLVSRQGDAVPHKDLLARGWDEMTDPKSNVLAVVIGQLRRKLREPQMIHTVAGVGYRVSPA